MPNIIDLSTPEKLEAFGRAMQSAAATGKPVDLANIAQESETLEGPKVCYETDHYQIIDRGEDWKGFFTSRFSVQRRPEFKKSRVMHFVSRTSNVCAEALLDALNAAEKFHMENLPFCGWF